MHTPADIRAKLAAVVTDRTGLRTTSRWTDIATTPCALIRRTGAIPRTDFGKTSPGYAYAITFLFDRIAEQAAQDKIDRYIARGTNDSVWDALEADKTLGGVAHTLILDEDLEGDRMFEIGGQMYVGAEIPLTVFPA